MVLFDNMILFVVDIEVLMVLGFLGLGVVISSLGG